MKNDFKTPKVLDMPSWTYKSLQDEVTKIFTHSAMPLAKQEASYLVADLLGVSCQDLLFYKERPVEEKLAQGVLEGAQRRNRGEPLGYISGRVFFDDLELFVNPYVLLPRQETELLVERFFLRVLKKWNLREKKIRVLDLATGSGAIAFALERRFRKAGLQAEIFASDVSHMALEVARKNSQYLKSQVEFREGSWLEPWPEFRSEFGSKRLFFDAVICNPPYIAKSEIDLVGFSVLCFEPQLALFAEEEGLAAYRHLSLALAESLGPRAVVGFEIGFAQGSAIEKIFTSTPWVKGELEQDLSGHDRFFFIEKESFP